MRLNRFAFATLHTPTTARAFVATEAAAITVVALVFIGILLATTGESRRLGMLNRDLANLRQIGAWTAAYASDNEDLLPAFTSAPNTLYSDIRRLASGTPVVQAAGQAIDIIRRRTGRDQFPIPSSWLPHPTYSHLVLADYADRELPDTTFVSTGDKYRLNWLDDPINKHDQGFWQPFQNPSGGMGPVSPSHKRWAYSASYQFAPATYDQNQSKTDPNLPRISQSSHNSYSTSNAPLGTMKQSDISYPGQKVILHDYGAWHFSKQTQYFAHETARVALLMGDGGASPRLTTDANLGWDPNNTTRSKGTIMSYYPREWEPPTTPGAGSTGDRVRGYYRWTRGGLKGRDFDGPEIYTGQP